MGGFCHSAWDRSRALCVRLWAHRTALIGVLGMVSATAESFLADNPAIHLPHRGNILLIFAGVVTATGLYNSIREYLDRAPPP
jgi:hypothetical protein